MKVERIFQPSPIIVVDDFLTDQKSQEVLEECISLRPVYRDAEVLKTPSGGAVDHAVRQNEVVYMDTVFQGNRHRSKILQNVLQSGIWGAEGMRVWGEGNSGFEVMNRVTRWETVLSRFGDGDFYDFHQDWNFNKSNRLITAVYYAAKEPSKFKGGRLTVKTGEESAYFLPRHNRLLVFNSGLKHSVEKVQLPGNVFEEGRFSINIWLGYNS